MDDAIARLRDARAFAKRALSAAKGLRANEPLESQNALYATLYCICIAAEALKNVPEAVKSLAPGIPWKQIKGTRNRVLHSYRQIDFEIVSDIVESHLEPLIVEIDSLIELLRTSPP